MAQTLHAMFVESARAHSSKTAFLQRATGATTWTETTYAEALARVEAIGAGLIELGVGPEGRVSILAASRRVDPRRLRHPGRRRDGRADLPDQLAE